MEPAPGRSTGTFEPSDDASAGARSASSGSVLIDRTDKRRSTPTYGDLLKDPQKRLWAIRIGIALAAGLVGTLVFDWRLGLSLALIAGVAHTVYVSQQESSVDAWRKGKAKVTVAHRRTERALRRLERDGYRVLHARTIPGMSASVDHLVIGRNGVFVIDSEGWDERLPVTTKPEKLYHGPFHKMDRLDEANREAVRAGELLSEALKREVRTHPGLALYGPTLRWDILVIRGVAVFTGRKVRKFVRRGTDDLSDTDIEKITEAAERVLPPRYG
ncbi:nuclease-related domain-containing protein [Allonocardiopsis opalescens]|uniref:nuclease-related domain-containing protein n=1 Tax=Allonocardiopsis opalescens TaxID=1144618 RepID=UPI001FEC359F|nr:nuclease-related domain-containing protein [Allonocardiopsis opalescens]